MWVYTSGALYARWFAGRVFVDKNIVSAWEQLRKRDERQVRPVVRSPSVPFDYLYNYSRYSRTKVLRPRPLLLTLSPFLMPV
jgi:hypothetical protein